MRKQYFFAPSAHGFDAWDVDRLIRLSASLPVREVALVDIPDIDTAYWFGTGDEGMTVRHIVQHMRLVGEADPSYPIILSDDGRVMDGMHRIARALLEGRTSIRAVQLPDRPQPDYRDCHPDELPY
jgi:hypothetical protein